MEVRATAPGFYGKYRNIDDVFDVEDGSKATWFKPTKEGAKRKAEKQSDSSDSKDGEQQD